MLRAKSESYGQDIKALSVEKNLLERSIAGYKNKIEGYEAKNKSLEAELELSQSEIGRISQELEDHKDLGANFRRMIDELVKQRDGETANLKEQLEILIGKLNSLQKEHEVTLAAKKQLEQYASYIKSMDYENKLKALEKAVVTTNDEKMALQDQVIKLEAKIQQNTKVCQVIASMSDLCLGKSKEDRSSCKGG